jgi:hypothetical protein
MISSADAPRILSLRSFQVAAIRIEQRAFTLFIRALALPKRAKASSRDSQKGPWLRLRRNVRLLRFCAGKAPPKRRSAKMMRALTGTKDWCQSG